MIILPRGMFVAFLQGHYFLTKTKGMKARTEIFELMVDGTPVEVIATPYFINHNMEKRIRVSFNGSPVHIFAWDDSANRLQAVNEGTETIPHKIEVAIAQELENRLAA